METFALDFMFPLIMENLGWKTELKGNLDLTLSQFEAFVDKTEVLVKASPAIGEELAKGNYLEAAKKAAEAIYTGSLDKYMKEIVTAGVELAKAVIVSQGGQIHGAANNLDGKALERGAKILKLINTGLQGADILRIVSHYGASKKVEEWTIRAKSAKVTLLPSEETVPVRGHAEIKAEVKNLEEDGDTHPFFKWSTSGKYGEIQDSQGNKGSNFESSDSEITYYSNTSAADLPEENNFEYVYVEAYYKGKVIGRDTTRLNLRKNKFQLLPRNATLTGRQNGTNSVAISIEPVLANQEAEDFEEAKIVWETEGKFGKLTNGGAYSTTITTQAQRSITYRCLDADTKNGTDKVYAKVYMRSAVDGEYFLYETLEAQVKILNDDKVLIKHVPIGVNYKETFTPVNDEWGWSGCSANMIFRMAPVENAEKYRATVLYYYTDPIPSSIGKTENWTPESKETVNGKFEFLKIFVNSRSAPTYGGPDFSGCTWIEEKADKQKGMAEVVIYLKD